MKKFFILFPIALLANIKEIKYEGLLHLSPLSANSLIEVKINDPFDLEKIDKSIKNLYKSGYFKQIEAIRDKDTLIFKCTEKPVIVDIEFKNLSEELKKILKDNGVSFKRGEILSKDREYKLQEFIKSYYLSRGYFNTKVEINKKFLSPTQVKLEIIIIKGSKLTIKHVYFFGATRDKSELLDQIENREKTIFSILPFANSGELNLLKLIQDKDKLKDYYLNLGYLDVYVSNPLAKLNFDSNIANIEYLIKEGNRYLVKGVKVDYPKNINVNLNLHLKINKYFNVSALRQDLKDIAIAFKDKGYAYAEVYPEIKKENNYVYIIYKVIPHNKVYIRNVIIKGNDITLDRVVRRDIYLAPFDLYSYTDLIESKYALQRRGYFDYVNIKEKKVSPDQIDLIVEVKEGLTGSFRGGISYGSYSKLGVDFSLSEKNVFGSGNSIKASLNYSKVSSTYKFSFYNPRILDSRYSFNTSIYKTKFIATSYTSKKSGFNLGVGKELTRFVNFNISYELSSIRLSDYSSTLYQKDKAIKSAASISLTYNSTNRYFFPTKGKKLSVNYIFAGIGGDEKFSKTNASLKLFYPIIDKIYQTRAVLKYKLSVGKIFDHGYLPIDEKYFLGGIGSIKGFSYGSISPTNSNNDKIGGDSEFLTSGEISIPLNKKTKMWGSLFLDYGAVGENKLNITRSSYGFSLDWITPVGPLKFVWAWPLKSEKDDDTRRFEFTIGAGF